MGCTDILQILGGLLTASDKFFSSNWIFGSFESIRCELVALFLTTEITIGADVASSVTSTSRVGSIHWGPGTCILQQFEGAHSKAVAAVKAKFSENWEHLKVQDHVLHQFELQLVRF